MATITTINAGDQISNSRSDINTNFANLNSDKIETSVIDTDTALAANSDSKIPSQKAVKAYVDSGGIPTLSVSTASTTTLSVTTTASQRLVVWAKGRTDVGGGASNRTYNLKYNGVVKDTITVTASASSHVAIAFLWTAIPGAGTNDITIDGDAAAEVVITALVIG